MNACTKWLDCFQFCRFLKLLGHVMVLLVVGLVAYMYYTVVLNIYGPMMLTGSSAQRAGASIVVILFSITVIMLLWSYFAAVTTDPGRVPPGWHPFEDEATARSELDRLSELDYAFDRRDPRRPRFCKRCQAWKPERAHHCSASGHCVLKMDHYCIWVVNCVGLLNYKFFLLFLAYTAAACTQAAALLIKPTIDMFSGHATHPLAFIGFVVAFAFGISLLGFLGMHIQLIAANCTTIEMYEKERLHPWPYNKGFRRNLEDALGKQRHRWLLPVLSKEERRALLDSCLNSRLLAPLTPAIGFSSAAV